MGNEGNEEKEEQQEVSTLLGKDLSRLTHACLHAAIVCGKIF